MDVWRSLHVEARSETGEARSECAIVHTPAVDNVPEDWIVGFIRCSLHLKVNDARTGGGPVEDLKQLHLLDEAGLTDEQGLRKVLA